MIKDKIKEFAARSGVYIASTERFGLDVDLDILRLTSTTPLATIFDVGANVGQSACHYARVFSSSTIFSFEPVPDSYDRLKDAVRTYPQVRPFNCALGEEVGRARINLMPSSGSNSLKALDASADAVEVRVDTIDNVCAESAVDTIDLLKIDVEGFELQVLRGAADKLRAGKVGYVFAECVLAPNSEMPHTSFFDLHELLTGYGFCFVSYYAESFRLRLGCALGNVLYARRDQLPRVVPGKVRNIV